MHITYRTHIYSFAALAVVFASLVSLTVTHSLAAEPSPPLNYVALGDSRAAAPTYTSVLTGDGCGQTASSYPRVLAAKLGAQLIDKACTAAKTDNILTTPQRTLLASVPVQIDAVESNTDLVTVSIGGNDIGWSQFVDKCISKLPGIDRKCRDDQTLQPAITSALTSLQPKVEDVLEAIKARAPHAKVVLVGHGGLYDTTGCAFQANYSNADGPVITGFFAQFNDALRTAADAQGVTFIDVDTPAQNGHDVCSGSERWFNGDAPASLYQTRHPTPLGSKAMADLIYSAL